MTQLIIIVLYLGILLGLGLFASRLFRGTSQDYMLASHSIGPFLLLMSLFGTTMTAFALVGSTGRAYHAGVGVYGLLAASSGIVHSLCFYVLGVRLWQIGRRNGYTTQIQFFRDRLESHSIGLALFPVLVGLVIPYLLIGVLGAGSVVNGVTRGEFPELFSGAAGGGVPAWLASAVICMVVLIYVFFGGMRGTAWANTFQTLVFMVLGVVTFVLISNALGGLQAASRAVAELHPEKLNGRNIPPLTFFSFLLIPLSVGMFPHVFQHWLTARSSAAFKLPIVAHPLFIMIVWIPCVLVGVWATSATIDGELILPAGSSENVVLATMVGRLTTPLVGGFLTAGILAAIMSSLDSQFLCLGTMFTEDIALHYSRPGRFSEKQTVLLARGFIVLIVAVTYAISLLEPRAVFTLGIWCFSGFSALVPLAFAAIYWKRLTAAGAWASVLATAGSWVYFFLESGYGEIKGYSFYGMMPVAPMMIASTVALVGVSLLTKPPSAATLARFFPEK